MNICILCKGQLEALPPIMSLILVLKDMGHNLEVVTGYSEQKTKSMFSNKGIYITDLFTKSEYPLSNIFSKFLHWKVFSKRAWRYIDAKVPKGLLWVCTADTAMALGPKLLRRNYILQILELYDTSPLYRYSLKKYAQQACSVVVPEMCRAAIFRSWFHLEKTPTILPNKPANHPHRRNLKIEDEQGEEIISSLGSDKKIVLYQGHIGYDRDISPVAEAIKNIGNNWQLVAMGPVHGDYLDKLRISFPNIIYIPRVIAPSHLQITSHAYIGVITYSYNDLNNVFCAPNKVWEYSGFGLPMLCSELPPLKYSVQANNAGICVDMNNIEQIESSLTEIDLNYDLFSLASKNLYDSVNIIEIASRIIEKISHAP